MGFYTGRTGALVFNGKPVAKVQNWSVETSVDLLPTADLGADARSFIPSLKGATGNATLMYYRLEPGESAQKTQFTALLAKIHKRGAITERDRVFLELDVDTGGLDDIKMYAYITNAVIGSAVGELVVVPIQFTMDGDFDEAINQAN
jgi:hypothetical protein